MNHSHSRYWIPALLVLGVIALQAQATNSYTVHFLTPEQAKENAARNRDVPGSGNGYVSAFDLSGSFQQYFASQGTLNSPRSVAIAPPDFGAFGGAVLIGNFGDGTISAFSATNGDFLGRLQDASGKIIVIPRLWAIWFGSDAQPAGMSTLSFTASPSAETPGLFGSIQPAAALSAPAVAALVNGASFAAPATANGSLAPGSIAALFGTDLVTGTVQATITPLPTTLGDTDAVTIGTIRAPLIFVSGTQINLQIPFEAGLGKQNVVVTRGGQTSAPQTVTIVPASPGIFRAGQTGEQGAILNAHGVLVDNRAPAVAGDTVQVFCTGLGATTPAIATGAAAPGAPPAAVNLSVSATVGEVPATVSFAGLAAGFVGLYQVNVQIPAGVTPGNAVPLVLTQNGISSNSVTLAVSSSPSSLGTGLLAFSPSVAVQPSVRHGGGEPTLQIGRDGTLWITDLTPAQIWKSSDRGATWSLIPPPLSLGGGDMDAAPDDAGRVHVLDLSFNAGCIFYYRSSDGGKSFDLVEATPGGGVWLPGDGGCSSAPRGQVDRPWVATWGADTVYLVNKEAQTAGVNTSLDGGQTFTHATPGSFPEPQGIAVDPSDGTLYMIGELLAPFDLTLGKNMGRAVLVARSPDGRTFSTNTVISSSLFDLAGSEFPSIAVDAGHNIYATWSDNSAGTTDVYVSVSRDRGKSWGAPIRLSSGLTVSTFPTITAADAGRVAVAWFGTPDPAQSRADAHGANWYVYAALSTNGADANPSFETVKVTDQPFHHNSICAHIDICEGIDLTTGQTPPGYEGGIFDFFRIAVDPTGALNLVWPDTTSGGSQDHFARQTGGRLLKGASVPATLAK